MSVLLTSKFLLLVIIFTFFYEKASSMKLLVLGDTGQFEEFVSAVGDTSNDVNVFSINSATGNCTGVNSTLVGFKNFKQLVIDDLASVQKRLCNADEIVILGDMTYTETGKNQFMNRSSTNYTGFKNRLLCSWSQFKDVWRNISNTCPANSTNPLKNKTSDGLYENLDLITGNHSYDVDFDIEAEEIASTVTNRAFYFDDNVKTAGLGAERVGSAHDIQKYISISTKVLNNVTVQFLDVNLLPIACYLLSGMQEANYTKCYYAGKAYGLFPPFADAQVYTNKFILALQSFSPTAQWRVIRSHNPIFSAEGALTEQASFFSVVVDNQNNTLLDLINVYNVNLFLNSHNHYGQVQIFPYSASGFLTKTAQTANYSIGVNSQYNFDGTACELNTKGKCTPKYSCYYDDRYFGGYTNSSQCKNGTSMTIKHNNLNPNNLLVLLVGFSGRAFDPVESDQRSAATIIYDMGVSGLFGGAQVDFGINTLNVTFFSGGVDMFTLTTVSGNDNYPVLNNYALSKIQRVLLNQTYNYSLFNTTSSGFYLNIGYLSLSLILSLLL